MAEKLKILGGPGCGKSFELMKRYQAFLNSDYTPKDITLITFRKSSADDLISLVSHQTDLSIKDIKKHVGTIHSICWRLSGYVDVMSPADYSSFVTEYKCTPYMKAPKALEGDDEAAYSGNLFDLYTWLRNTGTPLEKWVKYPGIQKITMPVSMVPEFLRNYEAYKRKIGKIDYSDMIQLCLDNKIELDTSILMVDEFQDLTSQMFKLFNMWAAKCSNVIVAGDPFQSIYGYFGGSPDYFNELAADELILTETHRLPEQIQKFAQKILKLGRMTAPDMKAKQGYTSPIKQISYNVAPPTHSTELHLVRCNYQACALAMALAESGKVFGGMKRYSWKPDEVEIANAVLAIKNNTPITENMTKAIVQAYPAKMFGKGKSIADLLLSVEKAYHEAADKDTKLKTAKINAHMSLESVCPDLRLSSPGYKVITPNVVASITSNDPTAKMTKDSKLFTAKIRGVLKRNTPIQSNECRSRMILTIHGSKGLEADAVFLHTSITKRIHSALIKPTKESEAEARVWYVGATRAREILYLVKDLGINYTLPGVEAC